MPVSVACLAVDSPKIRGMACHLLWREEDTMKHADALELAEEALNILNPHCERILIAGSIRRMKSEVKDIEICAIPKYVSGGLFGDEPEVDPDFIATVNQWPAVKGQPTGKYTQRVLPGGMKLDLFIADPENWGYQLVLRTGSADFNRKKMLPALKAHGYAMDEGYIWHHGQIMPTREETDLWALSGLPWLEPWAREVS
jgi:DNA polymerase/3'-5' exonuclease PolX